jgi:hypothetical protein
MDYEYISSRTRTLKKEIEEISNHSRKYFARRPHTEAEILRHRERQERVLEIRAELSAFMKDKVA